MQAHVEKRRDESHSRTKKTSQDNIEKDDEQDKIEEVEECTSPRHCKSSVKSLLCEWLNDCWPSCEISVSVTENSATGMEFIFHL